MKDTLFSHNDIHIYIIIEQLERYLVSNNNYAINTNVFV